ncbi:glycosyltransferase [Flavobacteriales bacterium]|nr:glycosyltransferase [Flavobacteriales bacterium]
MGKNRILFISYDGLTDPLGQSQVLPYLIHLNRLNYEIHILSTEKNENFLNNKKVIESIVDKENLKWFYIEYTKTPPIFSTIKDVRSLNRRVRKLHKQYNYSFLHCRSYISALVGLSMKRKFGLKFLFDMRGFWADERIDGGIWNPKLLPFKMIYNFFKKKEKQYLLEADHVISLTYNGKNEMRSWDFLKNKNDNISVIPCCADLEHFDFQKNPIDIDTKRELGIKDDAFVLCYLGSVGTWYMQDEMLDYFKVQLKSMPNSVFLWITKDDSLLIIEAAEKLGIADKMVIKPSERSDLPKLISICDASIFFIKPLFSKKASSPTKQAELLGMGIPLICNSNVGDTNEILEKENVGLVTADFTEAGYQNIVDGLPDMAKIDKHHLRNVAIKHFSLKEGVKKYDEVYKGLVD